MALGSIRWLPPYRVEIETWGEAFGDVVFGRANDLLVSERFAFLWEEARLVGIDGSISSRSCGSYDTLD
jgi:hypothetical protein